MTETAQQAAKENQKPKTFAAKAFAAQNTSGSMSPHALQRREPRPQDVQIEILFCGVCHSDLHTVENEWVDSLRDGYPLRSRARNCRASGESRQRSEEIQGRRLRRGRMHGGFRPCLRKLPRGRRTVLHTRCHFYLQRRRTQFWAASPTAATQTASWWTKRLCCASRTPQICRHCAAVCAGITTYSPMRHWKVSKGQKVGVIGLGGLGHMGVKFAKALWRSYGAFHHVGKQGRRMASDWARMKWCLYKSRRDQKHAKSFNFILDTVSAEHDIGGYLSLLKMDGTLVLVGAPRSPSRSRRFQLIPGVTAPARPSAASARRRRCSISARTRESRRTSR